MRRVLAAAAVVAAVGSATVVGLVTLATTDAPEQAGTCLPSIAPIDPGQGGAGADDAAGLDEEQRGIVGAIVSIGRDRALPPRAWQIAIQAGMTESRLRNLDYGDRDSLGIFQMRPSMGWGTVAQLQDIPYQVTKFYEVLLEVPGWDTMRPGDAAQRVERSAFPDRYHQWEPMALHLLGAAGVTDAGACAPGAGSSVAPSSEAAAVAIGFALAERGKPYVWGATGPGSYDCSGLMLRAYEAAGISLPRVSREQWRAGAQVPLDQAQPGDLLFWARDKSRPDATIHHVAMYLGDGQIVEAQQTGVPVHTRAVKWTEGGIMPVAVRPGAAR